jgi:hypothetical protein
MAQCYVSYDGSSQSHDACILGNVAYATSVVSGEGSEVA